MQRREDRLQLAGDECPRRDPEKVARQWGMYRSTRTARFIPATKRLTIRKPEDYPEFQQNSVGIPACQSSAASAKKYVPPSVADTVSTDGCHSSPRCAWHPTRARHTAPADHRATGVVGCGSADLSLSSGVLTRAGLCD